MSKVIDLTGQRFGQLTVIEKAKEKGRNTRWICKCDCGNECIVRADHLKSGNTKSCGHDKMKIDLTGQRFNYLTVIGRVQESAKDGNARWLCQCDCGNTCIVRTDHLKSGNNKSCGCKGNRMIPGRQKRIEPIDKRIVRIYAGMHTRCYNPNVDYYKYYGGRGITICDEWLGKDGCRHFYEWAKKNGYRKDLTIDRIDVNGNYEPSNCRWANSETQANNKRKSIKLLYNGKEVTMKELSDIIGVSKSSIYQAYKNDGRIDFTDWNPPKQRKRKQ